MRTTIVSLALAAAACNPTLPFGPSDDELEPEPGDGIELWLEPELVDGESARVVRARVVAPPGVSLDDEELAFVRGEMREGHLRQLERREPSRALTERFVPTFRYREPLPDGRESVVLSPLDPLEPGELYALAEGRSGEVRAFTAASVDPYPILDRVWPPVESPGAAGAAVWCASDALPSGSARASLSPADIGGSLHSGVTPDGRGAACVRFAPDHPLSLPPGGVVPPPLVSLAGQALQLHPAPILGGAPPLPSEASEPVECDATEVPFGPGCAVVEDDRIRARAPDRALLWAVTGHGLDAVFVTHSGARFVVRPLPPSTTVSLTITVLDVVGESVDYPFSAVTRPPMAHVVLNEVLANPVGPEPEQEWVELYNDGLAWADLEGLALVDVGGETWLPAALLAPGAFALLVNPGFAADGEYDPAPAPGTSLLVVDGLGKNGLANAGEPLKLVDAEGDVLSRFPAEPKPKSGESVARSRPDTPADDATGFFRGPPTPGSPNLVAAGR